MKVIVGDVTYYCTWKRFGFAYAHAIVHIRAKFLGVIPYWKPVWCTGKGFDWSGYVVITEAQRAHKDQIIKWYESAIKEYLEYEKSWSK